MINRIRAVSVAIIILLTGIFSADFLNAGAEKIPDPIQTKIRILILSKTMRLIKEGKSGQLDIKTGKTCELFTGEKRVPCRSLSVYSRGGLFHVTVGRNEFTGNKLVLYPETKDDVFNVNIDGETRSYPLPLYIINNGREIELSVEETADQYAIDSASAELGPVTGNESEALYALAHLIRARCFIPGLKNRHKGYDFCDLTCCQVYRGRSGKYFSDPVRIRTGKTGHGLFFHASSGGVLFTDSIFSSKMRISTAPKDIIYSKNLVLSTKKYPAWQSSLTAGEISGILYPGKNITARNIIYDREREIIFIETAGGMEKISPETFRLVLNRVRGWNFIKSNNYTLTVEDGIYKFRGTGLGHGTGLSMEGALQLAGMGYSRYEILEHYYPGVEYALLGNDPCSMMQYVIFSLDSGEILESSTGPSFMNRTVPCGSIFKLFTALYLASERKDLFHKYTYTCRDTEKDRNIPGKCWNKTGHGRLNIAGALCNSCNKYFASLYRFIDADDFRRWIGDFIQRRGINLYLAPFTQEKEFASVLAGLDFRITIDVSGLMKLAGFIYRENQAGPSPAMEIIFSALHRTFTEGTAKEDVTDEVIRWVHDEVFKHNMWGKTGTVITGTNSHYGYGIFAGGYSSTGIISLFRKSTGALTAKKSGDILYGYLKK